MRTTSALTSYDAAVSRGIGETAYATVEKVAAIDKEVATIAKSLEDGVDFKELSKALDNLKNLTSESIEQLASADLAKITEDLNKGSVDGKRKLDIDISKNKTVSGEQVKYDKLIIESGSGASYTKLFTSSNGSSLSTDSPSLILDFIRKAITEYNNTQTTTGNQITGTTFNLLYETDTTRPTIIQITDDAGETSNLAKVTLFRSNSSTTDVYYWSLTTSALATLNNNITDIQNVNENIGTISGISDNLPNINTVAGLQTEINDIANTIVPNMTAITQSATNAQTASTKATEAAQSATDAQNAATTATNKANSILNLQASASTLTPDLPASAVYNPSTGVMTFGIPKGDKGDKGDSFVINATGITSDKATYDNEAKGFSFLDMTQSLVYFKLSNTSADWSNGVPFGKGDKGDKGDIGYGIASIVFTSTTDPSGQPNQTGAIDTYTITYTDNTTTSTFTVKNGDDGGVASVNGNTGAVTITKSDVGLGNVDNTSDANKPISTATQLALDSKLNLTDSAADSSKLAGIEATKYVRNDQAVNMSETVSFSKPVFLNEIKYPVVDGFWLSAGGTNGVYYNQVYNKIEFRYNNNVKQSFDLTSGNIQAANFTGIASEATKLSTARNITLTGEVSGTASFDGTSNIDISTTLDSSLHAHDDRYYTKSVSDGKYFNRTTGGVIEGSTIIEAGQPYLLLRVDGSIPVNVKSVVFTVSGDRFLIVGRDLSGTNLSPYIFDANIETQVAKIFNKKVLLEGDVTGGISEPTSSNATTFLNEVGIAVTYTNNTTKPVLCVYGFSPDTTAGYNQLCSVTLITPNGVGINIAKLYTSSTVGNAIENNFILEPGYLLRLTSASINVRNTISVYE